MGEAIMPTNTTDTLEGYLESLRGKLEAGGLAKLTDSELAVASAAAEYGADRRILVSLLREVSLRLGSAEGLTEPYGRRYAELLGCADRPDSIAAAIEQLLRQRDRMRRTIGKLRGRLAGAKKGAA